MDAGTVWDEQDWRMSCTRSGDVIGVDIFNEDGRQMSYLQCMRLLRDSQSFRLLWQTVLNEQGKLLGGTYFWECIPTTPSTIFITPMQYVLVGYKTRTLTSRAPKASCDSFAPNLESKSSVVISKSIAAFPNLSGDSILIVPKGLTLLSNYQCYLDIGTFTKSCPYAQQDALWQYVGQYITRAIEVRDPNDVLWLNTHGLGVPWIHIRLDQKPKYYAFEYYKRFYEKPGTYEPVSATLASDS